jgi:hypothetical protein
MSAPPISRSISGDSHREAEQHRKVISGVESGRRHSDTWVRLGKVMDEGEVEQRARVLQQQRLESLVDCSKGWSQP